MDLVILLRRLTASPHPQVDGLFTSKLVTVPILPLCALHTQCRGRGNSLYSHPLWQLNAVSWIPYRICFIGCMCWSYFQRFWVSFNTESFLIYDHMQRLANAVSPYHRCKIVPPLTVSVLFCIAKYCKYWPTPLRNSLRPSDTYMRQ